MIVGFIEPVGTSFQSATAERTAIMINKTTSNDRFSRHQCFHLKFGFMPHLTAWRAFCSPALLQTMILNARAPAPFPGAAFSPEPRACALLLCGGPVDAK